MGSRSRRGRGASQERGKQTTGQEMEKEEGVSKENLVSRQTPRQGRRRSRQEGGGGERKGLPSPISSSSASSSALSSSLSGEMRGQPGLMVGRGRSASRESLGESRGRRKRSQSQQRSGREEQDGGVERTREDLRQPRGGGRRTENEAGKQSLAGEFIDFYLGRGKK